VPVLQRVKHISFIDFTIVFVIIRIISIANSFPANLDSDSGSYSSGDGFTNWNWVSFSGAEFGRGWPTVVIFSLVSSNSGRIFLIQIINLLAWILFGYAGSKYLNRSNKSIFFYILLFFGNSIAGQLWNNWIGRESLAFSLTLFAVSFQLLWLSKPSFKLFSLMTISISLYAITKPSLVFICIAQFSLLVIGLVNKPRKIAATSVSLVFVSVFSIYTFVNIGNQDRGWGNADPTGRTTKEIAYSYLTSDFNPNAVELRNYFGYNGAPVCATLQQPSTVNNLGGPMEHAAFLHANCDGFSEWINNSFYLRYLLYSITHVDSSFEVASIQLRDAFTFPNVSRSNLFSPAIQAKFIDLISISAFLSLLILLLLNYNHQKNRNIFNLLVGISLGSVVSILFGLMIQPTHAGDISRQNYVSTLTLRLVFVFMALFLVSNRSSKGDKNQ